MKDLIHPKPSFLTARIFVQDSTARDLAWMSRVEAAQVDQEPSPQAVDALADAILREWLDAKPSLAMRQRLVRVALKEADDAAMAKLKEANL